MKEISASPTTGIDEERDHGRWNVIYISSYSTASATFASCERESTNAIQVKWIPSYSPPFSREPCRGDDFEDDRFLLSFFPFEREARMLWESRRSKATSFSQNRGPTVAVWLSRFESPRPGCREREALPTVVVLSFMYYKNGVIHRFKETTVAESCPRNFERKHSSWPLCALLRLSRERY